MAYQNIAVAGATGNLGPSVVNALVDAGLTVTVLSKSGKTDKLPSSVKTVKTDYSSQSFTDAFKGQDAVVSLLPNHDGQPPLIDAAIEAGVKFFLPSEFGSDIAGSAKIAALPVFAGKVKTQEYLKSKQDKISYAFVVNGLFLDWGIGAGFNVNLNGPTRVIDGGNDKHSTTTLEDVGKATVAILKNPDQFKNRAVYIQSAAVSQNELIAIAEKKGKSIQRVEATTEQIETDAWAKIKNGTAELPTFLDFIALSALSTPYGNNWSAKNDNELVGIKEKTQEELEQIVAQFV
ncbi:Isoflavone reductase P3 [Cercospora beticola]|uniref:Isoflavone reductase P3 n=1 Tax=Cercospora beticola TaxID=122368 RepID=A0A2G5HXV3_CERBT|nr:Isoflavone reductase P3 [Cercospora beticola]PIA97394.1 Isoflavone reductase P3 [Cercospora beticola]WPA98050.1 hypothetical protein RHO25_002661 [Cercospora beticola]CAK1359261.1 unnamed protein product [Cercospora beticola]